MRLPRLTVFGIMAIVACLALWFTVVRVRSSTGAELVVDSTIAALLMACLLARFGKQSERDWWFGFALFGWASLLFVEGGEAGFGEGSIYRLVWWSASALYEFQDAPLLQRDMRMAIRPGPHLLEWRVYYTCIGCAVSVVCGVLGGMLASVIAWQRDRVAFVPCYRPPTCP